MEEQIRKDIENALEGKPYIFRTDPIRQSIDGLNSAIMANFDCRGIGPEGRFFVGRKVAYPKQAYIEWVVSRIQCRKVNIGD